MEKAQMKTVGRLVSIFMGLSITLVMSILGPLKSGHITAPAVLVSFLCGSILSTAIALLVPIKKISDSACGKIHVNPEGFVGRIISSLIGDVVFTPLMTFAMVFMNYKRAKMVDPNLVFGKMFIGNFIFSFIIAFFLVLIFIPLFIKAAIAIVRSTSVPEEHEEENI